MKRPFQYLLFGILFLAFGCDQEPTSEIDLFKIWTGDQKQPWGKWVAIKGNKIDQIGTDASNLPTAKESIDLNGKLMVPGFNDSPVHFASAGALLLGINLLDVNDEAGFVQRVKKTTPSEWLKAKIATTVLDGKVIYQ